CLHPVAEFADGAFDFTSARPIGPQRIDHAMTGIEAEGGVTGVELFGPDAADSGVSLSWDPEALPWVQIFTADVPDHPELDRRAVAVEAMACPPAAFNSGTDLLVLDPGETHEATWTIAAIGEASCAGPRVRTGGRAWPRPPPTRRCPTRPYRGSSTVRPESNRPPGSGSRPPSANSATVATMPHGPWSRAGPDSSE